MLDIACHDGRWSFAALNAGAACVTGIEVRRELCHSARQNLEALGYGEDRFKLVAGDVFSSRYVFSEKFDIVLCLGFIYHTTRHEEIIDLIRSTDASLVIVDTRLALGDGCFCELRSEATDNPANGNADQGVRNGMIFHSWPSREAVLKLLNHFGYKVQMVDWPALMKERAVTPSTGDWQSPDNPLGDYASAGRGTFIARLTHEAPEAYR